MEGDHGERDGPGEISAAVLTSKPGVQGSDTTIGCGTGWGHVPLPSSKCVQQRRTQSSGKIFFGIPWKVFDFSFKEGKDFSLNMKAVGFPE